MQAYPLKTIQEKKIMVVGDVMLDRYWFGGVDRISPEAPVPVVHVVKREDRLGGAANVARNIVALGGQASLYGVVGNDDAATSLSNLAMDENIQAHFLQDPSIHTTLKMRVLGGQQQLLRVDFENPPSADYIEQLYNEIIEQLPQHDLLVLSDYAKGVLCQVERLIGRAKELNIPVLVDPKGDQYERYQGASLVTPNQSEMRQAVGTWKTEAELYSKAQKLRQDLHLNALLVTRSEHGMTLFTEQGIFHQNAQAHEVFDVSGAGDTVLATLAVTYAAGLSWEEAIQWANKAGGIVVGKLGTSVVTAEELL